MSGVTHGYRPHAAAILCTLCTNAALAGMVTVTVNERFVPRVTVRTGTAITFPAIPLAIDVDSAPPTAAAWPE